MAEGINIARTVANELDSAKFDPLLVKNVAKYVVSSLDMFLSRVDGQVRHSCREYAPRKLIFHYR